MLNIYLKILNALKDKWISSGIILNIIFKLIWFFEIAKQQKLYGDENQYFGIARSMVTAQGFENTIQVMLGHQHRMPGTTLFIWVSQQFHHPVQIMRFYFMAFETLLFVVTAISMFHILGKKHTRFFVFLIATSPMLISFSFNVWGDLFAGWLWLLAILFAYNLTQGEKTIKEWVAGCFLIGIIWGISLYFRASMILTGPLMISVVTLILLQTKRMMFNFSGIKLFIIICVSIAFGYVVSWGPWMMSSTIFKDQLTYQPAQNVSQAKWLKWKIWAHSPNDEVWGYRRGHRYNHDLQLLITKHNGDKTAALQQMYGTIMENTTPLTVLSGWCRNITNVVGNENQFLAGTMWMSQIPNTPQIWFPKIKRTATRGGHQVKYNYTPPTLLAKGVLIFNSYWYYGILISTIFWIFTGVRNQREHGHLFYFLSANVLCVLSMTLYHPGHGRYMFSLLPALTMAGSFGVTHYLQHINSTFNKTYVNSTHRIHEIIFSILLLILITIFIFKP